MEAEELVVALAYALPENAKKLVTHWTRWMPKQVGKKGRDTWEQTSKCKEQKRR